MALIFAPTEFEYPRPLPENYQSFGVGPESARQLARKLNLLNPKGRIFLIGSATALSSELSPGATYLISEVKTPESNYPLTIPRNLGHFPQTSLYSSQDSVYACEERQNLFEQTNSSLLDQELGIFFDELNEELHSRVLALQGVVNRQSDPFHFIKENPFGNNFFSNLIGMTYYFRFLYSFFLYRKGMQKMLENIEVLEVFEEAAEGQIQTDETFF